MIKLAIYLTLLTLLLGAAYKTYAVIYDKGVADTELAYVQEIARVKDEAAKNAVEDYRAAQIIAGDEIDTEIKIVTVIREIEREIPVYIDRIIEIKPECSDLPELGELFSKQAAAANFTSVRVTEDPG